MMSLGAGNMLLFMVMYILDAVFDSYIIMAMILKVWVALSWRDATSWLGDARYILGKLCSKI
jgi:hypothetical protein